MAFKEIDIKNIIKEERKDKKFDLEYKKVKQEYNLIQKFIETRKEKSVTQEELAQITGVSQQAISRLELEKHMPKMDTFIKILDGLDLELSIVEKHPRV